MYIGTNMTGKVFFIYKIALPYSILQCYVLHINRLAGESPFSGKAMFIIIYLSIAQSGNYFRISTTVFFISSGATTV